MKNRKLGLLLLAGFVVGCGGTAVDPPPASVAPVSGIAFTTDRHAEYRPGDIHNNRELYLVQPDGTGLTRLTDNDTSDGSPSWSPDGRQIAYRSRAAGSADIFIMNADGTGARNLISDPADSIDDDFLPRWNPQRDLLAIYTDRAFIDCAWHRVALIPTAGGRENIRLLDVLMGEQMSLSWAPDGRHLAFSSYCKRPPESVELYVWDIDADEVEQLTDGGFFNGSPAYSPDGRFLAFHSTRTGNRDIFRLDLETGELVNLTDTPTNEGQPSWSPDGRQIAFLTDRDGNDEIYVMDADGGRPRNITNHPAKDHEPAWSPVP